MKWVIAFTIVITAGIMGYFYVGLMQKNNSQQIPEPAAHAPSRFIDVVHAFKDGEHRLSGHLKLSHSCYAVDAEAVHDANNPNIVTIIITVKDRMLDESICAKIPTNYPFQILAEGPESTEIRAQINNEEVGVKLINTEWQSKTEYITPLHK